MQLTPEQIQGILELVPRAQVDRLQGNKPYIRIGYWNQIQDLDTLQTGLAKLGLKATEIDDYDEDTGWGYWYELNPIQNENMINESKEEVEYLMSKFYEYRILAAEAGANGSDAEYEDFSKQAMEYYERAIAEMDKDAADMTDHLSDEDKALPNVPINKNKMNEINKNRWAKIAGINENDGDDEYTRFLKGHDEHWNGYIDELIGKGRDNSVPKEIMEMAKIILTKYPEVGRNDYGMFVDYDENGLVKYTEGSFTTDGYDDVDFKFQFEDGKVVDYSFDEQNY